MITWAASLFSDQGSGFCVTGKIEAGFVQTGDKVLAMPPNETCTVKGKHNNLETRALF